MEGRGSPDLAFDGLVHDLNNVFATVLDAADLLENDPQWSSLAAILHRNAARGRRILESYTEAGGVPFELEPVVASAIEFARDFLRAQGAAVEFRSQAEPGLLVKGPCIRWERALFNLLINSGRAVASGGVVEIAVRRSGDRIEIVVADDGPGISAEVLPRIFEPGFSTSPGRSGLGLHIVQSIVAQSGGSVTAANRPGSGGAVFCISVPVEPSAACAPE